MDAIAASTAASTHHTFADSRLRHALASWSHTSVNSIASTLTAAARISHLSHQYLPRMERARSRAGTAGASYDTLYRVTAQVAPSSALVRAWRGYAASMPSDSVADDAVTPLVRKAAAWCWRLLIILAAVVAVLWLVKRLEVLVVPVALAAMVTALLLPAVDFMDTRGVPRGIAVALVLLTGIAVVGGILT